MTEQYRGLPQIAYLIRWLEEFIAILSKPFLMIGFVVSMIDLLTQGKLLAVPLVIFGWALIQSVAVDACFFVTWHKVSRSWKARKVLALLGYVLLGTALGIVAWAAMDLQSLQQVVQGLDQNGALAQLGLNPIWLTHGRSAVAVTMGAVVSMISPEDRNVSTVQKTPFKWPVWVSKVARWLGVQKRPSAQPAPAQTEEKKLSIKPSNAINMLQSVGQVTTTETGHPGPVQLDTPKQVDTGPLDTVHVPQAEKIFPEWTLPMDTQVMYNGQTLGNDFILVEHSGLPQHVAPAPVSTESKRTDRKSSTPARKKVPIHVVEDDTKIRVERVISEHGLTVSNRKLALLAGVSPTTAGKWKDAIAQEREELVSVM